MALPVSTPPSPKKTILVVEDEPHIVLGLKDSLEFEGFRVITAGKGRDGVALARDESPDAVVLDLMLPDINGYAVCEDIRRWSTLIPIIMLTARSQETDKIRGLDAGADDYLIKPFADEELAARLRALLRRAERPVHTGALVVGSLVVDPGARAATVGDRPLDLGATEFRFLEFLARNRGMTFSRTQILERIWDYDFQGSSNIVDVYVSQLRRKLRALGANVSILTVWGVGYKLVEETSRSEPSRG